MDTLCAEGTVPLTLRGLLNTMRVFVRGIILYAIVIGMYHRFGVPDAVIYGSRACGSGVRLEIRK